jgi:hypothetical protein
MRARDDLEYLGVDGMIILKCKIEKISLGPALD